MFTGQNTDWKLLAKYLANETGEKENRDMEKWLNRSARNRALFGKLKTDWMKMDTMSKQFNVDGAWNKLHGRIVDQESVNAKNTGEMKIAPKGKPWLTPLRIAASLLIFALLGSSLVFIAGKFNNVTVNTASNERQKNIILPDGSRIFLNSNTHVTYAKRFNKKFREVTLSGEAFFEVTPDKSKPFIIHTEKADIRVVGTSFNIDTKNIKEEVEVYVSTGIVEFYQTRYKSDHVLLHPGEMGSTRLNQIGTKMCGNENPIAWKTGNMNFEETRLSEAIEVLNKIYRVSIVCNDPELNNTQTDGKYNYTEESLDTILAVFCRQNNMKVEKSDNKIYLSK